MPRAFFYWVLFITVFAATAIWSIPEYLVFNFGKVSFDQVLFFLTTEDGTMGTDRLVLLSALKILLLKPLAVAVVVTVAVRLLRWSGSRLVHRVRCPVDPSLGLQADRSFSRSRGHLIFSKVLLWVFLSLPFVAAYGTLESLGGVAFFAEHEGPDQFAALYVGPPANIQASTKAQSEALSATTSERGAKQPGSASSRRQPEAPSPRGTEPPLNLILLYVESLETTFSDPDYFAVDLNAPLKPIFDRQPLAIQEMAGTNWTTAGMIASQCAVPLATFIWNKAEFKPGAMLGNARCLGDYLNDLGYRQFFLVGPELKFSGMDKFYQNHGYHHTWGKQELLEAGMPDDKLTGWGGSVNDDTLLDLALEQILALHKGFQGGGAPFNVTVITTDNHAPDGYLSPRCPPSDLAPSFARVIDCTNRFVARFYEQLNSAGVLKDTVLVVMGDHLFMNNPEQDHHFPPRESRRVFFNFRSPRGDVCEFGGNDMTHFDVLPTVLALLTGNAVTQMGLGDNLCQPVDLEARHARHDILKHDIASHSQSYRSLW